MKDFQKLLNISNEALMFQKKSAIGADLEKIFQEVIDYKSSIPFEDQPKKVVDYCMKTMLPKFKNAIKKNLNLTVENITVNKNIPKFYYAINITTGNEKNIVDAICLSKGYKSYQNTPINKELKEVLDLYKILDPKTGKFLKTTYGSKDKPIFIVLCFDIAASFLLDHFIDPNIVQPFTAKEITAIELHELGHFYEMIENFQNIYYISEMTVSHLSNIAKNSSPEELANTLLDNKDFFNSFKGKDKNLDTKIDTIFKVCDVLLYLNDNANKENNDSISKLRLISFLILKCITVLLKYIFLYIIGSIILWPILELAIEGALKYSDNIPPGLNKNSDTMFTYKAAQSGEVNADQYSVRSGYGPDLISGMAKLDKAISTIRLSRNMSSTPWLFKSTQTNLDLINLALGFYTEFYTFIYDVHEVGVARLEHMLKQHIAALKSAPPDIQILYLNKYEQAMKELDNFKLGVSDTLEKISMFFNYILDSPSKFVSNLVTGRLHPDYYKLQAQIEDICNNKLYYYGLKLQQLAK